MQLVFKGDPERLSYLNNPCPLQESKDTIQREIAYISRKEHHHLLIIFSEGGGSALKLVFNKTQSEIR